MSEAEKQPFVKLMKEDRQRYLEEVEVYEIKNQIAEKTARLESEQKSLIDSSEDETEVKVSKKPIKANSDKPKSQS